LAEKFIGKTVAAIIEFPDDKILLIKRGTKIFRGYWALPGGRVEPKETVEETVVREVKEETGLDIEILEKIGEYHEKGVNGAIEYDYYPTCFHVKPKTDKIVRQEEEIEEIKLFDIKHIPESLAFKHSEMIEDYKKVKIK
jgi:8-oxo-dGTP diphosphatase